MKVEIFSKIASFFSGGEKSSSQEPKNKTVNLLAKAELNSKVELEKVPVDLAERVSEVVNRRLCQLGRNLLNEVQNELEKVQRRLDLLSIAEPSYLQEKQKIVYLNACLRKEHATINPPECYEELHARLVQNSRKLQSYRDLIIHLKADPSFKTTFELEEGESVTTVKCIEATIVQIQTDILGVIQESYSKAKKNKNEELIKFFRSYLEGKETSSIPEKYKAVFESREIKREWITLLQELLEVDYKQAQPLGRISRTPSTSGSYSSFILSKSETPPISSSLSNATSDSVGSSFHEEGTAINESKETSETGANELNEFSDLLKDKVRALKEENKQDFRSALLKEKAKLNFTNEEIFLKQTSTLRYLLSCMRSEPCSLSQAEIPKEYLSLHATFDQRMKEIVSLQELIDSSEKISTSLQKLVNLSKSIG